MADEAVGLVAEDKLTEKHSRDSFLGSFQYFIDQIETIYRAKIVNDINRNLVSRPKRLGQKHGAYRGPSRCDARHVFKPNTV